MDVGKGKGEMKEKEQGFEKEELRWREDKGRSNFSMFEPSF
jgi:hypothetical protein